MELQQKTKRSNQTKELGKSLAIRTLKNGSKERAIVFGLEGELGGGKTTFTQGFARGLGIKEKILSPTFVIMKRFKLKNKNFSNFYHIDAYRIEGPKELLDIDFKNIIKNPKNIVIIEWANKIKKILPKTTTWIRFKFINEEKRVIFIKALNFKQFNFEN